MTPGPEGGVRPLRPYETLIIFDPDSEETAVTAVLDRVADAIKADGGAVGEVDRWGKRTFAYELRHKREGYYVLVEFTSEPKGATDADRLLYLADEVMRHKIIRLPDKVGGRRGAAKAAGSAR